MQLCCTESAIVPPVNELVTNAVWHTTQQFVLCVWTAFVLSASQRRDPERRDLLSSGDGRAASFLRSAGQVRRPQCTWSEGRIPGQWSSTACEVLLCAVFFCCSTMHVNTVRFFWMLRYNFEHSHTLAVPIHSLCCVVPMGQPTSPNSAFHPLRSVNE